MNLYVLLPTVYRFPELDLFNALSIVHPKLHRTLDSKTIPALVRLKHNLLSITCLHL